MDWKIAKPVLTLFPTDGSELLEDALGGSPGSSRVTHVMLIKIEPVFCNRISSERILLLSNRFQIFEK